MAVNPEIDRLTSFTRRVVRRLRLAALLRHLAVAAGCSSVAGATVVLYDRLTGSGWPILWTVALIFAVAAAASVAVWWRRRPGETEAAFAIDRSLSLEDRFATAHGVLSGPVDPRPIEQALLVDTDARISPEDARAVAPVSMGARDLVWTGAVALLLLAFLIPARGPEISEVAAARADIETAADRLDESAAEVRGAVPEESQTASLADEQEQLAEELRRSVRDRSEALRMLNALEDRIRERRDDLAETRADEIVELAESRLKPALEDRAAGQPAAPPVEEVKDPEASKGERSGSVEGDAGSTAVPPAAENPGQAAKPAEKSPEPARPPSPSAGDSRAPEPAGTQPPSDGSDRDEAGTSKPATGETSGAVPDARNHDMGSPPTPADAKADEQGRPPSATPGLSRQLKQLAEELRANKLKPEDMKRLVQAARLLSRDLSSIAQSKELRDALEQLARNVDPEQLEDVARELLEQEDIRKELEAARRLLAENQEAKQIVAGIRREFEQQPGVQGDRRGGEGQSSSSQRGAGRPGGKPGSGVSPGSSPGVTGEAATPLGGGRLSSLQGQAKKGSGGEYLFLQSRPGTGAARVPYSEAYPAYRSAAERNMERSQVPPSLRTLVRKYFDSINPDAGKQ